MDRCDTTLLELVGGAVRFGAFSWRSRTYLVIFSNIDPQLCTNHDKPTAGCMPHNGALHPSPVPCTCSCRHVKVPLDVLTLTTDEAGVTHLTANECGITISGEAENLAHLKAVILPPPQSGFVSVDGEQYIATSPILRCRWTGEDCAQGPWTVSFPLEEEDGLSDPTELSQVLRRGDNLQDEWEVQTAGLKASTRHPSMQVEVTHFSDVMTADKLRDIEKRSTSSFYKRKRVWGTKVMWWSTQSERASGQSCTFGAVAGEWHTSAHFLCNH